MRKSVIVLLLIACVFLFSQAHPVSALQLNFTKSFSQNVEASYFWSKKITGLASSCQLQAYCDTVLCLFYIFDQTQFIVFQNSNGQKGNPIVMKPSILPNSLVTLRIDPDGEKTTFRNRFGGPLYMVITNLGQRQTFVKGFTSSGIYLENWLVALLSILGFALLAFFIILIIIGIVVCLHRRNKRRRYLRIW
jgi:hypothetical protein